MDNEWKNSLRERFSDYSAPEPEGLWEGIEQGLAEKKRRKMLPVWLVTGLAAAAAVALVVFLPTRKGDTPVAESEDRYAESIDRFPVEAGNDDEVSVEARNDDEVSVDAEVTSCPAPTGHPEVIQAATEPVPFAVVSRRTLLAEAIPASAVEIPELIVNETGQSLAFDGTELIEALSVKLSDPIPPSRFSVGAYQFGGQAASEQSRGFGLNRSKGLYRTRSTGKGKEQNTGSLMEMLSSNKASSYEAHHSAPMRVGITLAWEMTPHLSLASGLNWTALNSTFEETAAGVRNYTRQDLGYLGIPLRLEAGFRPWKGLRLYAGAGGMVEKGLLAHSVTSSYIGDYLEDSVRKHPDTGGLLWSVGASAGAEYRFNRLFSIYLSPGIEYHFDNGSPVKSAYTEKPLHWNAAVGIRFNFWK